MSQKAQTIATPWENVALRHTDPAFHLKKYGAPLWGAP
jgi:hypothetical protein